MAAQHDPDSPLALNALGMEALGRGDAAAASGCFERAVERDPAAPALWMNLAKARRLLGDDAGEAAALDSALATDQRHFMALVRRAELHERLVELPQANARWLGVIALSAGLPAPNPALDDLLRHARAFVGRQSAAFEAALAPALDAARAEIDGQERRRFDVAIDAVLGKRRIYSNTCDGLHFPFLPADEFFARAQFDWLESVEARTAAVRAEFVALVEAAAPGFAPYVAMDPGVPENKWSALDNSLDWSAYYLWKMGTRIDEACSACPETAATLDLLPRAVLPGRAPTAFFSVLKPGARIPPHTGVSNTRAIVHLPLIVPDGCGFRVGGETREWREGEAFAFDDTIEHEAWNDGDRLRAVLIFDVWNPHLTETEQRLLQAFYAAADASGFDPGSKSEAGDSTAATQLI